MDVDGGCETRMEQSSAFFRHCIFVWAKQGQNVRKEFESFSMIIIACRQVIQTCFTWMLCKPVVHECNDFFINLIDRIFRGLRRLMLPLPRLAVIGIMAEFPTNWGVAFHQPPFLLANATIESIHSKWWLTAYCFSKP